MLRKQSLRGCYWFAAAVDTFFFQSHLYAQVKSYYFKPECLPSVSLVLYLQSSFNLIQIQILSFDIKNILHITYKHICN